MHSRWLPILALPLFLAMSCDNSGTLEVLDGAGDLGSMSTPIINGEAPDQPYHGAVVSLHELTKGGKSVYVLPFCSGTLVSDTVVVTAAHCLDVSKKAWEYKTMGADKLAVYVGDDPQADIISHLYTVSETDIYTSYDPQNLLNDIAVLRLASPVTEGYAATVPHLPASLGFSAADIGATINFAGFGDDEFGNHGIKLQVDGTLGGLGCTVAGCPDAGDEATQISYNQYVSGPCFGDSGGPAFIDRNGTTYLGGVTSYGDSYCEVYGVSTRVDSFQTYIDDFANVTPPPDCSADGTCNPLCADGEDPDCDTPPDCSADGTCNPECADGEDPDCDTPPVDCGNGVCDMDESCDGRYGTVSCSSDCPGKTNGKPSGRYCWVGDTCEGPGC